VLAGLALLFEPKSETASLKADDKLAETSHV
jgi:hypothetical protein